jgi:hypothetical protein
VGVWGRSPRRHEPHISLVLAPRAKPIALSSAAPLMPRSGHVVADLQLTRCLTVGRTGDQRPVGHDRRPRWSWPMTGGPGGTGVRARQTSQAPGDSRSSFAGALSGRGRRVFVPAARRPRTTTLCPHHDNPALPVAPTASTADGPVTTAERARTAPCAPVPAPGAVRYMSVDSRKQPDSQGRDGTPSRETQQPARPGKPRSRAVFAGGGRCCVQPQDIEDRVSQDIEDSHPAWRGG